MLARVANLTIKNCYFAFNGTPGQSTQLVLVRKAASPAVTNCNFNGTSGGVEVMGDGSTTTAYIAVAKNYFNDRYSRLSFQPVLNSARPNLHRRMTYFSGASISSF